MEAWLCDGEYFLFLVSGTFPIINAVTGLMLPGREQDRSPGPRADRTMDDPSPAVCFGI